MFDVLIIDEIRKRKEEDLDERPQLELPLPEIPQTRNKETKEERRVIIIDTMDEDDEFTFKI